MLVQDKLQRHVCPEVVSICCDRVVQTDWPMDIAVLGATGLRSRPRFRSEEGNPIQRLSEPTLLQRCFSIQQCRRSPVFTEPRRDGAVATAGSDTSVYENHQQNNAYNQKTDFYCFHMAPFLFLVHRVSAAACGHQRPKQISNTVSRMWRLNQPQRCHANRDASDSAAAMLSSTLPL